MLKLNTDEKRSLQFEVSIQGIDYKELTGSLKFVVEDVEYGFPVTILSDHIAVEVPPLDDIIIKGLQDNVVAECRLDIFGNGFYLNPWSGQFTLKTPVKMEAKMRYSEDVEQVEPLIESKPKKIKKVMKATLKEEAIEPKEKPKALDEDNQLDLDRDEMLEILFERLKPDDFKRPTQTTKKPVKKKPAPKRKQTKQQLVEAKVNSKRDRIGSIVDNLLERKTGSSKPVRKKRPPKKRKEINIENINNPVALMESLGLRNSRVQKIMLERAETMGGSDNESLLRTLKQMLTNQRPMTSFEQFYKTTPDERMEPPSDE